MNLPASSPEVTDREATHGRLRNLPPCVVAGVRVDRITLGEAVPQIAAALHKRSVGPPFLIMGPNAHLVTLAQRDARFFNALLASSLNVPDGISVVLASKILGRRIFERVPGGEVMERLCLEAAQLELRVFFLGGLPGAAVQASLQLQLRYPTLSVAGAYCPPQGFEHDPIECTHIRQLIADAAPDLLFVAFGAPKQEIWMHENCPTLPVGAAMAVGAAFDTQSGLRRRAPRWTHKLGIEWLYRLVHEPRRLWRRYLIGNMHFTYLVLKQRLLYGRMADLDENLSSVKSTQPTDSLFPSPQHACDPVKSGSRA